MIPTLSRFRVAVIALVTGLIAFSWGVEKTALAATWSQQAEFSTGLSGSNLGYCAAISGNTALVGAVVQTVGTNVRQGAAYAFAFNGTSWVQQPELTASDGQAGDEFGNSVAISGNTAFVGAWNATVGANTAQGAVYLFAFNGTSWVQQAKLTASDPAAQDDFGTSIAVSGNTALIGAPSKTTGGLTKAGVVYVFTFNGTSWVQQAELPGSVASGAFGTSVAISGNNAVVGASSATVGGAGPGPGVAYVYTFNGANWVQQAAFAGVGPATELFGHSVAISGNSAVVGASNATVGANQTQGAAYMITFNGTSWVQQAAPLTASDGAAGDHFGVAVAISGNTVLVGRGTTGQGAANMFAFDGTSWVQQAELTSSDGVAGDGFGRALSLSSNAVLVGAPAKSPPGLAGSGAAYVFASAPLPQTPALPAPAAVGLFALLGVAGALASGRRRHSAA
jgi:hypothetical protein